MRLRNFAGNRHQHGEGQFGRRNGVAARRVHHHDAPLRRGINIDVVHADPGASDRAQLRRGFDDFPCDLGFGTNHDCMSILDQGQEVRFGCFLLEHRNDEVGPLLEQRNSLGRNWVTYQNVHKMRAQCSKQPGKVN